MAQASDQQVRYEPLRGIERIFSDGVLTLPPQQLMSVGQTSRERQVAGALRGAPQLDDVLNITRLTTNAERPTETRYYDSLTEFQDDVEQQTPLASPSEELVGVITGDGTSIETGRFAYPFVEGIWNDTTKKYDVATLAPFVSGTTYVGVENDGFPGNDMLRAGQAVVIRKIMVGRQPRYWAESGLRLTFFHVALEQTGGAAGGPSSQCSFTYTVRNQQGATLLTGVGPSHRLFNAGLCIAATSGICATQNSFDNPLFLWMAMEQLSAAPC